MAVLSVISPPHKCLLTGSPGRLLQGAAAGKMVKITGTENLCQLFPKAPLGVHTRCHATIG